MIPAPHDIAYRVALASCIALFCAACPAQSLIVVTVETDLLPGEDFASFRIEIENARRVGARSVPEQTHVERSVADDDENTFPLSFVLESTDADALPEVTVEALDANGHVLVSQTRRGRFEHQRTVVLRVSLEAACRYRTSQCTNGETCGKDPDRCEPVTPPLPLREITPGRELEGLALPPTRSARHIQRTCRDLGAEEGCDVAYLPGGRFTMGDPDALDATPMLEVTVDPFVIDRFEYTLDRLAAYVGSGNHVLEVFNVPYPDGNVISLAFATMDAVAGCSSPPLGLGEPRPVVCRTWDSAAQLCAFDGGRLPTSAEWEYAARFSPIATLSSPRPFPWGASRPSTSAPCDRAFYLGCDPSGIVSAIGSIPTLGLVFDLGGNAAEWTSDRYEPRGGACFPQTALDNPNCLPPMRIAHEEIIIRGGGISLVGVDTAAPDVAVRSLMGASVAKIRGDTGSPAVGFRCVYSQ